MRLRENNTKIQQDFSVMLSFATKMLLLQIQEVRDERRAEM